MSRFGASLSTIEQQYEKFSFKTVNQIGMQMIDMIKSFHKTGYVHNDIKPDNICLGTYTAQGNINEHQLKLIDFGCATKY